MAVTVRSLFKDADRKYHARFVAGGSGLGNLVEWVHIVEDKDVSFFLHGQEVVFTAGILNRDEDWMLEFAHNLKAAGVSAFVVNFGPYTKTLPESVISFCNQVELPLYTIPWETRMVDMTRDFVEHIFRDINRDTSLSSIVKDLIFETGDMEQEVTQLERFGFRQTYAWTFVGISLESRKGTNKYDQADKQIVRTGEYLARSMHDLFVRFHYREKIFFLLVNYTKEEVRTFVEQFVSELSRHRMMGEVHMGIGENVPGPKNQKANFERTFSVSCLARRRKEKVLFYRDLDIDRLLISIRDEDVKQKYYADTLLKLEEYDTANGTALFQFLRLYLKCDCSPQAVSEAMYIHRNTVSNYLKKVESILDIQALNQHTKTELYLAYQIYDLLDREN